MNEIKKQCIEHFLDGEIDFILDQADEIKEDDDWVERIKENFVETIEKIIDNIETDDDCEDFLINF